MTRIVALAFAEQPGTPMRWLCGAVADFGDGVWAYAEMRRDLWIAVPAECDVPESALAQLHERLTQSRN